MHSTAVLDFRNLLIVALALQLDFIELYCSRVTFALPHLWVRGSLTTHIIYINIFSKPPYREVYCAPIKSIPSPVKEIPRSERRTTDGAIRPTRSAPSSILGRCEHCKCADFRR